MAQTGSATTNTATSYPGGPSGNSWGETRYLNEQEWGTEGSNISGNTISTLGKRVDAQYNFALSHTALTAFIPTSVYYMSWYQPKYAATYAADKLRRYSAGQNDSDKVKAYCFGARSLTSSSKILDITAADYTGAGGVVTLASASSLIAGAAIALGAAALAI